MAIEKIAPDTAKWNEAVSALKSGAMTRQQAAGHVGLSYMTFTNHLKSAGILDELKAMSGGSLNRIAAEDPERQRRYSDAVNHAIKYGSVKLAADKYEVNYQVLSRRVRAAKISNRPHAPHRETAESTAAMGVLIATARATARALGKTHRELLDDMETMLVDVPA
jgi:hypothetical protein